MTITEKRFLLDYRNHICERIKENDISLRDLENYYPYQLDEMNVYYQCYTDILKKFDSLFCKI